MKHEQDGVSLTKDTSTAEILLSPSSWLTNINFINHLVLFNNIMTVVVAEKGGGKTSFAKIISRHIESSVQYLSVKADNTFSAQKLLEAVNDNFHFSLANGFDFASLCRLINERQKHVLLAIDDAHNLNDDFIEELLQIQLAQQEPTCFHILLIADYSILPLLNRLTKTDYKDKVHTIELGNLTLTETSTYVKRAASKTKYLKNLDNNILMARFHQQTEGAVSQINATWETFFSNASTHKKPRKGITKMRIAASLFVFCGALALFMKYSQYPVMNYPELKEIIKQKIVALKPEQKQKVVHAEPVLQSRIPGVLVPHVSENVLKESIIASIDWPKLSDIPKSSQLVRINDEELLIPIPLDTLALESSLTHIPQLSIKNSVISKKQARYTVQIIASQDLSELKTIIKRFALQSPVHIYKTVQKDIGWYVLTFGEFDEWHQAHDAIEQLPKKLASRKPWIRPVKSLPATSKLG